MQNENAQKLEGKNIVMGVCSSIAVYKAAEIVSALKKLGAGVTVVMTENACRLMSPRVFQTLSRNPVYTTMWEHVENWKPEHISLAEAADLLLVAPATANAIGNFASGVAPDMLSTLFLALDPSKVLIAPAMNCGMYAHPAVQKNMGVLKSFGVEFIDPDSGVLACGTEGKGRLADINKIVEAAAAKIGGLSK